MWVIRMQLGEDNEHDLKALFDHMNKESDVSGSGIHLLSLAEVLHNMGKFDLAERMLKRLLSELPLNDPSLQRVYWSLGLVTKDKGEYGDRLEWFIKVLELYIKIKSYN